MQVEFNDYLRKGNSQMPPLEVYEEMAARTRGRQNRELKRIEEDYTHQKERQARLALALSRPSAAGSASYAAMSIVGTGLERDLSFRAALGEFRTRFTRYYNRKSRELVELTRRLQAPSIMARQDFTDMPEFEFEEEFLGDSLSRALPDLGFLALWAAGLFAVGYFKFPRHEVSRRRPGRIASAAPKRQAAPGLQEEEGIVRLYQRSSRVPRRSLAAARIAGRGFLLPRWASRRGWRTTGRTHAATTPTTAAADAARVPAPGAASPTKPAGRRRSGDGATLRPRAWR